MIYTTIHKGVRLVWRLAYQRIVNSAIWRTGVRSAQDIVPENISKCTLCNWRRIVAVTCFTPSSAPKEILLKKTSFGFILSNVETGEKRYYYP